MLTSRANELIGIVADECGFESVDDMLEAATFDSIAPGICPVCECSVDNCEPDAHDNWCDTCNEPTVKSVLVLAGLV